MAVAKEFRMNSAGANSAAATLADQLVAAFQRQKGVDTKVLNRIINRDALYQRVLKDYEDNLRLLSKPNKIEQMFYDRDIFNLEQIREVMAEGQRVEKGTQDQLQKILGVEKDWKQTLKSSIRNLSDDLMDWGEEWGEGLFGPFFDLGKRVWTSSFFRNIRQRGAALWRLWLDRKRNKATLQSAEALKDLADKAKTDERQERKARTGGKLDQAVKDGTSSLPPTNDNSLVAIMTDTREGVLETWTAVDGISRMLAGQFEETQQFYGNFMDVFRDLPEAMEEAAGKETLGDWIREGFFGLFGRNGLIAGMALGLFGKNGLIARGIKAVGGAKNALGIAGMVTSGISGGISLYKGVKGWRAGKRDDETRGQIGKGVGTIAGQAVGAILGSIIPGAGTLLGAGIGGWVGNIAGEYIGKNWVKISKGVEKGWKELKSRWDRGWSTVSEKVSGGWTVFRDFIVGGFQSAADLIRNSGSGIATWVSNGWNNLVSNIQKSLSTIWGNITGAANPLVKAFQDSFSKVGEKLISSLKGVRFDDIFKGALGFILGPFKVIFKAIGVDVEKILNDEKQKDPKKKKGQGGFWDALTWWDNDKPESIEPQKGAKVSDVNRATVATSSTAAAARTNAAIAQSNKATSTPTKAEPAKVAQVPAPSRGVPMYVDDTGAVLLTSGAI